MNPGFFLACVRFLAEDNTARVVKTVGISQSDMQEFCGGALWTPDQRLAMRHVLDVLLYGVVEMAGLPRVDLPAEMPAAVIAACVSPSNWMLAASWQEGLRPARDLTEGEETVQIQRCSAAKMFALVCEADAAFSGSGEYQALAGRIQAKLLKPEVL